jgi:DNA-binding NarL/FixJ family response regulator
MKVQEQQIIIADNQYLTVLSLKKFVLEEFGITVKCVVDSINDLLQALTGINNALVIIDPPAMYFTDLQEMNRILSSLSFHKILILTNSLTQDELHDYIAIGIRNIIFKTANAEELSMAIRSAISGKKYYGQEVLTMLSEIQKEKGSVKDHTNLTKTEIEIVKLIAEGFTTREIALRKYSSHHTIVTHRKNIFRKINVTSVSELVIYAIRAGLIDNIEYHI